LIVVLSSAENVRAGWVESEWGAFVNEKRSGRKQGNVVSVLFGEVSIEELPLALRQYAVVKWDKQGRDHILSLLLVVG